MPRRVLVVGAGGFLGEHIVAQLVAAGDDVIAVVRDPSRTTFASSQVRVLSGDCTDRSFVRSSLEQADAAIFCAGRTWQAGLDIRQYQLQNVEITQAFFEAVGHRPGMRVVFTSSLSTIGGSRTPRVYSENSGREGIVEQRLSPYDRAKIDCENIALQSARSGNQVVVVNPGLLLGPGASLDSHLAAPFFLLWFLQGQFAARFYVNGGVTLSDVRDVAAAHVAALDRGEAGERYILGGHNLDRESFYKRVTPLVGLRMPTALPAALLYSLTTANDALAFISKGSIPSPVHRSFAYTQRLYYFGASDKAVAQLNYSVRPIEQTILDMILHYQQRNLLPPSITLPDEISVSTAPSAVLLRQLIHRSGYSRPLLPRLPELYRVCQSNHALRDALSHLLSVSSFDPRRGRFIWERRKANSDVYTLRKFIEYVYFSSNEFLQKVL
jgi:dihydroflavonol-4-reductase